MITPTGSFALGFPPMRFWTAGFILLLAGTALAEPSTPLTLRLRCFDAWEGRDLKEGGGGPGGAQWNTEAVVCEVRLDSAPEPGIQSVRIRLEAGQGSSLTSMGELYVPARPREVLAMGEETPPVEALAAVAEPVRGFFIPAPLFSRLLRKKSRQPRTGADVYAARFVATVQGLDAKGRVIATAREEVRAEFAFGE
jgi:hypothetical protein